MRYTGRAGRFAHLNQAQASSQRNGHMKHFARAKLPHFCVLRHLAVLAVTLIAAVACGGPSYYWSKAGVTSEQAAADNYACTNAATYGYNLWFGPQRDAFVYERCMEAKGYGKTSEPQRAAPEPAIPRDRAGFEAAFGPPVSVKQWSRFWTEAHYDVARDSPQRFHPLYSGLFDPKGALVAYKTPRGSGPDLGLMRFAPLVRWIEQPGGCSRPMSECVHTHEEEMRQMAKWLGQPVPPSLELEFRLVRQLAEDADAGRLTRDGALNQMILLDQDTEPKR